MCPPLLAAIPGLFAAGAGSSAAAGAGATAAAASAVTAAGSTAAGIGSLSLGGLTISANTISAITGAISLASAAASYVGQQNVHNATVRAANLDNAGKIGAINAENLQLSEEASEDAVTGAVKGAQDFGRIAASASTYGFGKSTTAPLIGATLAGDARDVGVQQLNIRGKRAALGDEQYGAELTRESTIAGAPSPTTASLALGIGKGFLDASSIYGQVGGKFTTG